MGAGADAGACAGRGGRGGRAGVREEWQDRRGQRAIVPGGAAGGVGGRIGRGGDARQRGGEGGRGDRRERVGGRHCGDGRGRRGHEGGPAEAAAGEPDDLQQRAGQCVRVEGAVDVRGDAGDGGDPAAGVGDDGVPVHERGGGGRRGGLVCVRREAGVQVEREPCGVRAAVGGGRRDRVRRGPGEAGDRVLAERRVAGRGVRRHPRGGFGRRVLPGDLAVARRAVRAELRGEAVPVPGGGVQRDPGGAAGGGGRGRARDGLGVRAGQVPAGVPAAAGAAGEPRGSGGDGPGEQAAAVRAGDGGGGGGGGRGVV